MKNIFNKKIYYHDTDCGGVVYYANYLKYCEAGRYEYLSAAGIELHDMVNRGYQFAVAQVDIKYHAPARLGDMISVHTTVFEIKNASMVFVQEIKKDDVLLAAARVEVVCVTPGLKLKKLPAAIRALPISQAKP